MFVSSIKLTHFKNYEQEEFRFSPKYNAVVGLNGMGKTNLLDAVYYLCMTKSNFTRIDKNVVLDGKDFFRLEAQIVKDQSTNILVCKAPSGSKKVFEINGKAYDRLADHVGNFPVVFIVPGDQSIISEGSKERRKLLDNTLSQLDKDYLVNLFEYNALLNQRNTYLKSAIKSRKFNESLAMVYSEQMADKANLIAYKRAEFVRSFSKRFKEMYALISNEQEEASCTYLSQMLDGDFLELTRENLLKDSILGRTTIGTHKDDLKFRMNGKDVKSFASQGQTKSFVISIKMTQFEIIRTISGQKPILLLDDIFDKLDQNRVHQLIHLLEKEDVGQVFISDTDEYRIVNILEQMNVPFNKFVVNKGNLLNESEEE